MPAIQSSGLARYATRSLHGRSDDQDPPGNTCLRLVRIYNILGHKGAKNDEKTGNRGCKGKKAAVYSLGAVQLLETDIAHIDCGVDGWCRYRLNAFDVLARRWLRCHSRRRPGRHGRPFGDEAVAGLSPEQVNGMRVRYDNGVQYKGGEFRAAANVLGLAVECIGADPPPAERLHRAVPQHAQARLRPAVRLEIF